MTESAGGEWASAECAEHQVPQLGGAHGVNCSSDAQKKGEPDSIGAHDALRQRVLAKPSKKTQVNSTVISAQIGLWLDSA
ncbi:unnamed protein product [Haemonchus placei]|uniref:Uncharacterized protein n=1 Tax=Haemonchus placei TaxID=6290 RepID=A0A0N4WU32_HAEPC|nr:unnamed protein product [Haemonchus placei]